jgi:hypothetical protein
MNHSSQHLKHTPLLAVLKVLLAVLLSVSTTVSGMNLPPREPQVLQKNRVWENFSISPETHLAKPTTSQQLQWEITASPTKTASGVLLYANGNPAMFTDPSGRFTLGEMSTAIQVSLTLGVITGFTVPLIRGPGDDIDGATYTELFAKCLYRNGGALAITVVGIAVGIDWAGEPLPKIGDELRSGFGGRAKSDVTTRLSRLSRQLNTWLKEELALTRRPGIRSLRVAGRLANAARGITNVVGAFAVGYTVGLIPGCALTAYLYKE